MSKKASSDGSASKGIFEIKTAEHFLKKFIDDYEDFKNNPESTRHALNAIMTGYHLHEWVWGDKVEKNSSLMKKMGVENRKLSGFRNWIRGECPEFEIARAITNGSKHFDLLESGIHKGAFSRDFPPEFDISYLYVCYENGDRVRADDIIENLMNFWEKVFKETFI